MISQTGRLRGETHAEQHLPLSIGRGPAMAAHGGDDHRRGTLRLHPIGQRANDQRHIRDAAAADRDPDPLPGLDGIGELRFGELLIDASRNVVEPRGRQILMNPGEPRQCDVVKNQIE